MTVEELKSLKVGQIVKYTNNVDALNVEYWIVYMVYSWCIELMHSQGTKTQVIQFDNHDINYIASMLTIDQPLRDKVLEPQKKLERELRLVEAKIRDAEFDMDMTNKRYDTYLLANADKDTMTTCLGLCKDIMAYLKSLRQQRNELIEKI